MTLAWMFDISCYPQIIQARAYAMTSAKATRRRSKIQVGIICDIKELFQIVRKIKRKLTVWSLNWHQRIRNLVTKVTFSIMCWRHRTPKFGHFTSLFHEGWQTNKNARAGVQSVLKSFIKYADFLHSGCRFRRDCVSSLSLQFFIKKVLNFSKWNNLHLTTLSPCKTRLPSHLFNHLKWFDTQIHLKSIQVVISNQYLPNQWIAIFARFDWLP